ncbi:MAG: hypothetical protein IPI34_06420 [bacterium]|nr:hypothetical protein [bacterium]
MLKASLPQRTWGAPARVEAVAAAHRYALDCGTTSEGGWVHRFLVEKPLARKLEILTAHAAGPGRRLPGRIPVAWQVESKERAAAFAFAMYPSAALGRLPIGAEGVNDLARVAAPILSVEGVVSWQERYIDHGTVHPDCDRFARVLAELETSGGRYDRARQFFNWCLVERVSPEDPAALEAEIDACVSKLADWWLP